MPFLCEVTSERVTITMSLTKARHQPNLCNLRVTPPTQDEECFYSAEEFSLEPCSVSCQVIGYDACFIGSGTRGAVGVRAPTKSYLHQVRRMQQVHDLGVHDHPID